MAGAVRFGLGFVATFGLLMVFDAGHTAKADLDKGADVFDGSCAECHSLAKPPRNKKGPTLIGIFGRKAAQVPEFDYSDALKKSDIEWDRDKLDQYIESPKKIVPGGKMKFDGLSNATERANLLDFLEVKTR